MKTLSIINFITHYVNHFTSDLAISRKDYNKDYIKIRRHLTERIVSIYLASIDVFDFTIRLKYELLNSRNDKERSLFSGLIKTIRFYQNNGVIEL